MGAVRGASVGVEVGEHRGDLETAQRSWLWGGSIFPRTHWGWRPRTPERDHCARPPPAPPPPRVSVSKPWPQAARVPALSDLGRRRS